MNEAGQDFLKGMKRTARRAEIAKSLTSGETSARNIIETVKSSKKVEAAEEIARRLINEEFVVHEEIVPVVEEMQAKLEERFPNEGISLLLLGSSLRGGAEVRKVMGTRVGDVDLGMLSSDELLPDMRRKIEEIITEHLVEKGVDLELCDYVRPSRFNAVNLRDVEDAKSKLNDFFESDLMLFFVPSFPAETNEKNRQFLFEALAEVSIEDPNQWENIYENLVELWTDDHTVKAKHLWSPELTRYYQKRRKLRGDDQVWEVDPGMNRSAILARGVAKQSKDVMKEHFEEMLKATRTTAE